MSTKNTPWNLPDKTIERADEADREIRMSDFALMAILPFRTLEVAGYPVNEFAMAALFVLCLFRPARGGAKLPAARRRPGRGAHRTCSSSRASPTTSTGPGASATW